MNAYDILKLLIIIGIAHSIGYHNGNEEGYHDGYVIGLRYGKGYVDGADGKRERYPNDPVYVNGYTEGWRLGHPSTIFA